MKSNSNPPIQRPLALLTSFVYFVQGALSLSAVAFPLYLRQRGWRISEIASFVFVVDIPWTLKLVYGAISDGVPLGGLRRKPYVILASLLSIFSWLGFALLPGQTAFLYIFAFGANLGFAFTDVVTDALIVENSSDATTQVYQSLAWGFRSLGAILGGFLGGWLAENFPYPVIFCLTALLPLTTLIAGTFIRESRRPSEERLPHPLKPLLGSVVALFQGDLRWFSLFILAGSLSASFSTPFFFFLKEKLMFSETFLGLLSSLTWLGAIGGCFLYGRFSKFVSLRNSLFWAVGLNSFNILITLAIVNSFSAIALSVAGGVLGYLSLLPLMGAAAVLSRQKGIEGSLFALIMSVFNLGQILSTYIGGKLFDIIGLVPLILLSALLGLVGFFFVGRLKTLGN